MDRYFPVMPRRARSGLTLFGLALLILTLGNTNVLAGSSTADDTTIYKYIDSDGNIVFTDHPTKGAQKIEINPPPPIPMTPVHIPETTTEPAKANPPQPQQAEPKPPAVPQMRMTPEGSAETVTPPVNASPASPQQIAPGTRQDTITAIPAQTATTNTGGTTAQSTPPTPAARSEYQSLRVISPKPGLQIAKPGGTIIVQLALTPTLNAAAGDRFRIVIDGTTMVDDSTSARHLINGLKPGQHTLVGMVIRQLSNHAQSLIESKPLTFELAKASK